MMAMIKPRLKLHRLFLAGLLAACAGSSTSPPPESPRQVGGQEINQGALIRHEYKTGEIPALCDTVIKKTEQRLTDLLKTKNPQAILDFESAMADLSQESASLTFMGYVHRDKQIRDESSACEGKLGQFGVQIFTRKDLYDALKLSRPQDAAQKRLLSETLEAFEKNGLKLPADKLAKVKALMEQLTVLETKFSANLNNDTSTVLFTEAELIGTSEDFRKRLKRSDDGRYIVTTKSTDYVQVMENSTNSETRRRMLLAYQNRAAAENTKLLESAVQIRQQIAALMGFKTWADYKTSTQMAKSGTNALKFLNGLRSKLEQRHKSDLAKLAKYKKEDLGLTDPVQVWDLAFLTYQLKKKSYSLDDEQIREYFPADVVMKGMFEVYSTLLGVDYIEVAKPDVWNSEVRLYEVVDKKSRETLAYFFADLVPREGKYGHAAAFTLRSGRLVNGKYNVPISSIVANFAPPSGGKPSLLNHDEVETTFHEFGHIMHQLLTRAPYASLSGTGVARDFVEAPSQMLENWVWSSEILNKISGHYKDPKNKLPADLLAKLLEAKDFNQGSFYTRQLMLGLFDLGIHTAGGAVDVTKAYDTVYQKVVGLQPLEGGHFAAGFGHMMGGYDAGYYGYLWSEVYAQDMFSEFEKKGILNEEMGARYRKFILEPGNMEEPLKLVEGFLGRKTSNAAFYKKLGLKI